MEIMLISSSIPVMMEMLFQETDAMLLVISSLAGIVSMAIGILEIDAGIGTITLPSLTLRWMETINSSSNSMFQLNS